MTMPTRPPPKVLLVHDGADFDTHLRHLIDAGLAVSIARGDHAVEVAIEVQPDIVILDFRCDGEIMARLKAEPITCGIPVIALAELAAGAKIFDVTN